MGNHRWFQKLGTRRVLRTAVALGVVAVVSAGATASVSTATPRTSATKAATTDSLYDNEAIEQLKARYFRTMDTKDWAAMRQVLADDVVMDTTASGGPVLIGGDAVIAFLRLTIGDAVTVHHGFMPEITLTSATNASGIWAMEDLVRWPTGSQLHGYGHYHETYAKIAGKWLIKKVTLTRLRVDLTNTGTLGDVADATPSQVAEAVKQATEGTHR